MDDRPGSIEAEQPTVQVPQWIARSITFAEGRDPLGFQTTTQDRLMPVLLPGVLELTRRARYFSFHAFLLDEYRKQRLPADGKSLSDFIKRCEWDLGLAVLRCPNHCGSSPVGARHLGNLATRAGPFPRGESVESTLGGYGLYYRSPMASFGIIARAGTLLGSQPIPLDLLYPTDRASRLAEGFRHAVRETAYYKRWMWSGEMLPVKVVDEYAEVACLCRLRDWAEERDAVHDAMFGIDPVNATYVGEDVPEDTDDDRIVTEESLRPEVMQRRRSVGHYLTLVEMYPDIVSSESIYRQALWEPPEARNRSQEVVAGQWAALIAKDVWQEAVCSVWSEFCRTGLRKTRELGRGITWEETKQLAMKMVAGPPELKSNQLTKEILDLLAGGGFVIRHADGTAFNVANLSLESLRQLTERLDTAASGLITALELARRLAVRSDDGWRQASQIGSVWQPSLAVLLSTLQSHLQASPSVAESLWWILHSFVLRIHERVSYSKLPEFTFRFRWENGLLRFYDNGIGRFPLAAIRNQTLALLTRDLGFWQGISPNGTKGVLTERGKKFVTEVFG